MHEVLPNLFYGDEFACTHDITGGVAVVHACKEPCHRRAVGYPGRTLSKNHQNYLVLEREYHLFLNLIDPPAPLFMMPSFVAFLAFVDKHIDERRVIIHCNQGESRAPSLALLYMAKRTDHLPNDSYKSAAQTFAEKHPYRPGRGIQKWLSQHWEEIE